MRRHLVIARCGRHSLHPRWIDGGDGRNWDLLLCPYEDGPAGSDFPVPPAIAGQKWFGLRQLLNTNDVWRDYGWIWIPDDDLMATADEISRFFDLCDRFNAALAQPALTEQSDFSFPMTMRNHSFFARATTFVEIMAPCFRRDALERLLRTLDAAPLGWGWGLEHVWSSTLQYRDIYIFDVAPVWHTRPVGRLRSPQLLQEAQRERARVLGTYGVSPVRKSLHACDEMGVRIEESQGRFLLRYLHGYDYLFDHNPRVMRRLILDQMPLESPAPQARRRAERARPTTLGGLWRKLRRRFRARGK